MHADDLRICLSVMHGRYVEAEQVACRVLNDVLDSAGEVVSKGRLGPGQMVVADLDSGTFLRNEGVCEAAATDAAYDEWLQVLNPEFLHACNRYRGSADGCVADTTAQGHCAAVVKVLRCGVMQHA